VIKDNVTIDTPLRDLLDQSPQAAPLLMQLGLDPAKHGEQTLRELGRMNSIDPMMTLQVMLAWDTAAPDESDQPWTEAPINELIDHIVASHHEYLRRQLPRIVLLLSKALHDNGSHKQDLDEILDLFQQLRHLLERHIIVQEVVVFPRMLELIQAVDYQMPYEGGLRQAMREMRHDFLHIGTIFEQLREKTDRFSAPPGTTIAYQAAMEELAELEGQLQRHTHVEEHALFPRVLELEQQLLMR